LLPALPGAWKEGEVKGLRARGGFVVDMTWQDGKLVACQLKSLLGNDLILSYKGKRSQIKTTAGKTIKLINL
ncbi:MAG TPA: hypothetical protein PLW67_11790, partial [Prolixibacteraceae bacterium]|nr:hypothetical protein [Prolixibacteraceae bacterium]